MFNNQKIIQERSFARAAIILAAVLIWALACGAPADDKAEAERHVLVDAAKSQYVIVGGKSATDSEAFAATEFQHYLEAATGVSLPVVNETDITAGGRGIYVGWTGFALKNGIDSSRLDSEEWVIQTVGGDLILTGGRPVGTLYAIYEFLETSVGCRWLDRDTEVVPRRTGLAISELKIKARPAFANRAISSGLYMESSGEILGREGLFLTRNKGTVWPTKFGQVNYGSPRACHTFYAYSKDFPADHPEYFSMDENGKRVRATSENGPGQLCLTNPAVRKLLRAQLKKFIAEDRKNAAKNGHPPPAVYDISHNDCGDHLCQCPNCRAFIAREEAESGLLIDCLNELADGVKDEYPDVMLMTFAYTMTLKTPKTVRPRDNVMMRLAPLKSEWKPEDPHYPDYFRPLSHPINATTRNDLAAWSNIAKHLAIWDYWIEYLDKFPTPYVNVACLQPDLRLFQGNRVENVYVECENPLTTSFSALKLWLGQKLLQDPDQPVEPLIMVFMQGYYRSAAAKMREYLAYMEKRIADAPAMEKLSSMRASSRPYLDLEFFTMAQRLLSEAERACGGDATARLHVKRERIPVAAAIYHLWPRLQRQLSGGRKMPFEREAMLRQFEECWRVALTQFYYGAIPVQAEAGLDKELKAMREVPDVEQRKGEAPPQLKAPRLPEMDGNPPRGEPLKVDWSKAGLANKWYTVGGYETERKVSVRVVHDGLFLYVRLEEICDPSKLSVGEVTWTGDDWEIFFADLRGQPPYHQFCVGPSGTTHSLEYPKKWGEAPVVAWDSGAKSKSERADGKWTVSIALPLDKLLPDRVKPHERIYANFCRGTPKPADHLAWSPTFEDGFHHLSRLGELILE